MNIFGFVDFIPFGSVNVRRSQSHGIGFESLSYSNCCCCFLVEMKNKFLFVARLNNNQLFCQRMLHVDQVQQKWMSGQKMIWYKNIRNNYIISEKPLRHDIHCPFFSCSVCDTFTNFPDWKRTTEKIIIGTQYLPQFPFPKNDWNSFVL